MYWGLINSHALQYTCITIIVCVLTIWSQIKFTVRAEQPRSDGGKGVGQEGSGRAEVSTNVTMVGGGEITDISGRAIMSASSFAGMQALDTRTQQ